MRLLFDALWQGLVSGTSTRLRADVAIPPRFTHAGTLAESLYWFAFETANALTFGPPH